MCRVGDEKGVRTVVYPFKVSDQTDIYCPESGPAERLARIFTAFQGGEV
jgi:hypothetical protein